MREKVIAVISYNKKTKSYRSSKETNCVKLIQTLIIFNKHEGNNTFETLIKRMLCLIITERNGERNYANNETKIIVKKIKVHCAGVQELSNQPYVSCSRNTCE